MSTVLITYRVGWGVVLFNRSEANTKLDEPEETESWMGLLPSKWNSNQINAWRRDPDFGMWSDPADEST